MTSEMQEAIRLVNMYEHGFGPFAMKRLKVCKCCSVAADSHTKYCGVCGAPLPQESMFDEYRKRHICCKVCDNVLSRGMNYCPQCGTPVHRDEQTPPGAR